MRCAASKARTASLVVHRRHAARRARSARLASARAWAGSATRRCSRRRPARSTSSARRTSATSSPARSSPSTATAMRSIFPFRAEGAASAACSSTCTSRARTAASSAARSIARAARSDADSRASALRPSADLVFSVPDSSNSAALGFAEESGLPLRARADSQSLRRPHVHPADAGGARRQGEGEVQRRARGARGQERRDGRRLDRARHDDARARRAWCAPPARAKCTCASARRRSPARATTASTRRTARSSSPRTSPSTRSPRTLGVDSLGYLSLDGMLESVPGGPARLLPCLLLRRLSHAAPDRSRQAALRLRLLTLTMRLHVTPSRLLLRQRHGRGHAGHEARARRQGRQPRRDDESRRSGAAGIHDRVRGVHRRTCATATYTDALRAEVERNLARLEEATGKRFGDPTNPLLVSVRSGAPVSMPGMMETILNLGLNDRTVVGLARASGNARFAYDSYRRFIQMYGDVVLGVPSSQLRASARAPSG